MSEPKSFTSLRDFIDFLQRRGQLVRVTVEVDPHLEITEICTRLLKTEGPAVLFERVRGFDMPVLANLFGTQERVGLAVGRSLAGLEELGVLLAELKQPEPPRGVGGLMAVGRRFSRVRHMPVRRVHNPPCREVIRQGSEVDLTKLPIQTCWPGDAGPLVTWPLVITRGKEGGAVNIGIYRMQLLGRNRLIMRWLKHRGGAQHAREHGGKMPVAVAIGCDPGTILAAVTPIPETLSEYAFAGLLREKRVETTPGLTVPLPVPAQAEIILEGTVDLTELAAEGPFGDHTGYYNEVEKFPVFTVQTLTMRRRPIYLSTHTGRPPDEPAILALALNRVFVPLLKKQFPEITDFHLSMAACSYRLAVVSLKKGYPGHAFRVMVGIWGFLRQFLYTKAIIVIDDGIAVDDWPTIFAGMANHVHAGRDIQILHNTPIDYLDFASTRPGLGGKLGIDATRKRGVEADAAPPLPPIRIDPGWEQRLRQSFHFIREVRAKPGGRMAVVKIIEGEPGQGRRAIDAILAKVPPGGGVDQLWVVDREIDPDSWDDLLWVLATRFDPARDMVLERESGRFALDLTRRGEPETGRRWGEVLTMDEKTREKVSRRWNEYGIG